MTDPTAPGPDPREDAGVVVIFGATGDLAHLAPGAPTPPMT